jgi:hypothetical protein
VTRRQADQLYAFAYRGLLATEAAATQLPSQITQATGDKIANRLPLHLLDEDLLARARDMAIVYAAIAAFENAARAFIEKRLLELVGQDWWQTCVPEKRRQKAESRRDEENKIRWHSKRGDALIEYTELEDLSSVIVTHQDKFTPIIPDPEWAKQIFKTVERSRNIIMHSGYLEREDIERLGMALRDWLTQVGG